MAEAKSHDDSKAAVEREIAHSRPAESEASLLPAPPASTTSNNGPAPPGESSIRKQGASLNQKNAKHKKISQASSYNKRLTRLSSAIDYQTSPERDSSFRKHSRRKSTRRRKQSLVSVNGKSTSRLYGVFADDESTGKTMAQTKRGSDSDTTDSDSDSPLHNTILPLLGHSISSRHHSLAEAEQRGQLDAREGEDGENGEEDDEDEEDEEEEDEEDEEDEAQALAIIANANAKSIPQLPTTRPERNFFIPDYRRSDNGKMYVATSEVFEGRRQFGKADMKGRRWTGEVTKGGRRVTNWICDDPDEGGKREWEKGEERDSEAVSEARACAMQ
ncbi:MAG: hypothetical protein Q9163_004111 [Psora crenata]